MLSHHERRPLWCVLAPFSDAQFNALKYFPTFPDRFGSLEDARRFGQVFLPWHNDEHHHSGLGDPTDGAPIVLTWVFAGVAGDRKGSLLIDGPSVQTRSDRYRALFRRAC